MKEDNIFWGTVILEATRCKSAEHNKTALKRLNFHNRTASEALPTEEEHKSNPCPQGQNNIQNK